MFKPLRVFEKAEDRKGLMVNYSTSWWIKIGQENAFYKFKQIVEFLHEYALVVCRLQDSSKQDHWSHALVNFHAHMQDFLPSCVAIEDLSELEIVIDRPYQAPHI